LTQQQQQQQRLLLQQQQQQQQQQRLLQQVHMVRGLEVRAFPSAAAAATEAPLLLECCRGVAGATAGNTSADAESEEACPEEEASLFLLNLPLFVAPSSSLPSLAPTSSGSSSNRRFGDESSSSSSSSSSSNSNSRVPPGLGEMQRNVMYFNPIA
jgi:hypothetical protein